MAFSLPALPRVTTLLLAPFLLIGGLPAGGAIAKDNDEWKVDGRILGEPNKIGEVKDRDDAQRSRDVSGIACNDTEFPMLCIVADDESQGAQVVIVNDGELVAGGFIGLLGNTFDNKPVELDAEGVAYADGYFYVIGSHGRPRHEKDKPKEKAESDAKATASRHIYRFELDRNAVDMGSGRIISMPKPQGTVEVANIIRGHDRLKDWYDVPLEGLENETDPAKRGMGLTIEGVAAKGEKLFVGLRGPMLPGNKAVVLEVPISKVFDKKPGDVALHELGLGTDTGGNPRGIRDIVPHMDGFLILAGPVLDPEDKKYEIKEGDYTIFSWSPEGGLKPGKYDIKGYGDKDENKVKPEAILPLQEKENDFKALLLFDGPKEGKPTPIRIEMN